MHSVMFCILRCPLIITVYEVMLLTNVLHRKHLLQLLHVQVC